MSGLFLERVESELTHLTGMDYMHGSPSFGHAHASAQCYPPAAWFAQPAIFNGRRTGSMHLGGEPLDDGGQGQGQGLDLPGSLRGGVHGHSHGFNNHPHGRIPSTPTSQFGTPSLIPDRVASNAMHSSHQLVSRLASQMQPQSPSLYHAPAQAQASPIEGSAVANPWNAGRSESMAAGARRGPFDPSLPKASNVGILGADRTPAQSQVQAQHKIPHPRPQLLESWLLPLLLVWETTLRRSHPPLPNARYPEPEWAQPKIGKTSKTSTSLRSPQPQTASCQTSGVSRIKRTTSRSTTSHSTTSALVSSQEILREVQRRPMRWCLVRLLHLLLSPKPHLLPLLLHDARRLRALRPSQL
jgi:hypothetical protein